MFIPVASEQQFKFLLEITVLKKLVHNNKATWYPPNLIFGSALTNAVYRIKNALGDHITSALLISYCSFVKFALAYFTVRLILLGVHVALRKPI